MKKITPEYITSSGNFRKLKELHYDDILGFVLENIKKPTPSSRFYFFINIINLILILYFLLYGLQNNNLRFIDFIKQFLGGLLAGSILVIPFHEGFHGLAYKIAGAPKIHFGADLRQMIFYVAADKYVLGRKGFYFLAYTPFVMINVIAIILYLIFPIVGIHSLLFFLLFHNLMCIGDFAMVSFFQVHSGKTLFTFDDLSERVSYIYESNQ